MLIFGKVSKKEPVFSGILPSIQKTKKKQFWNLELDAPSMARLTSARPQLEDSSVKTNSLGASHDAPKIAVDGNYISSQLSELKSLTY